MLQGPPQAIPGPGKSDVFLFLPTEAALQELGKDRLLPIFCVASGEEQLIKNGRSISPLLGKLEILEEPLSPAGHSSPAQSEQKETELSPWRPVPA